MDRPEQDSTPPEPGPPQHSTPNTQHPQRPTRSWTVGERVRLRKAHPCGATDWQITRTGADIRLSCLGCGRRVELPRDEFNRRVKQALDGPMGR